MDSLASSVEHKQGLVTKMAASQEAVMARGREAGAEAQDLQVKLKLVISKTKELQAQVCI